MSTLWDEGGIVDKEKQKKKLEKVIKECDLTFSVTLMIWQVQLRSSKTNYFFCLSVLKAWEWKTV
jgi:hypothetical protein